jgi:hypothetical protein
MGLRNAIVYVLLAAPLGFAHPHGMEEREFQHAAQPMYRRTLAHCQEAFAEPQFMKRTIERRHEEWSRLRKERGFGETYEYLVPNQREDGEKIAREETF